MKRLRRRDIRSSRQLVERGRGGVIDAGRAERPMAAAKSALASPPAPQPRSGEALASMQMRDRAAALIGAEAERLEQTFGKADEADLLRDVEADVRALPPSAASATGDMDDLVTEVAISITYALEATKGMPLQRRVEELARAALFLPSSLSAGAGQ